MKIIATTIIATSFAIQSFGQCLGSEQAFKDYFKNNISTLDPIEGIWSLNMTIKIYEYKELRYSEYSPQDAQVAIISHDGKFKGCGISGNVAKKEATKGTDPIFSKTASEGVYLYKGTHRVSNAVEKANAIISNGVLLEYSFEVSQEEFKREMGDNYINGTSKIVEMKLIKVFPSKDDFQKSAPSSGTGFGISSDGFIVTNHHVVNGATNINVKGIKGDFSKSYKAKVVVEDKNNDLAIIKIDDADFLSLGTIPFVIQNKSSDVGCSTFCLGYPLRATMGEEVKLTNGIISSKSGFQGDITIYQITNPVQPGNSGGPLFDNKGNLIGIVNAKHLGTENVSYAIKVSYLLNLIDIMPIAPKLQTVSSLANKTLSEQVKIIKNFTYIIEVN